MTKIRIALLQMAVKRALVLQNLATVEGALKRLRPGKLDFLVLPEMWTTDFVPHAGSRLAAESDQAIIKLQKHASRLRLDCIGSALAADGWRQNVFFNTATLVTPRGRLARYRKIHLFRPLGEHRMFAAGRDFSVVKRPKARIGLTICYDLRFPELFRILAANGAQIIFVPSAWPAERLAHWRALLIARALENQVFVVGCNRIGRSYRGFRFAGHSLIASPWGEVICEAGLRPGITTATLDLADIARARRKITVWQDRRPDLYRRGEEKKVTFR